MLDPITLELNVSPLILSALPKDISDEDVSTNSVIPESVAGQVDLICRKDGIIHDLPVFERVLYLFDPTTTFDIWMKDGEAVKAEQRLGTVRDDIHVLLSGEHTVLNYLQRTNGIATYTHEVIELLKDSPIALLGSHKAIPSNRISKKYAVKVGDGKNHRYNLSDDVLLKDNHIDAAGSVKETVFTAESYAPSVRKIEIEVGTLEVVKEAVETGADIIMLDNTDHNIMKEAVAVANGKAEIGTSGNVTKENLASCVDLSVQYVSGGAITRSAKVLDLSPENLYSADN